MKETLLFEKYRLVRLLSNGIGGEVWLAEHIRLGAYRVIKCLYKEQPFYEELLQEAQILKQLTKPFLPRIYDIEEDEAASYIIEEYLSGENLKDFILRQKCLPELRILQYSIQLCEIIAYLHSEAAGILHLDLKPENLLVAEDMLRVIDFGSAVSIKAENRKRCGFATAGYAAPEQYEERKPDERADIYGIGKLLQFMLEKSKGYDKRLLDIVKRCTRQYPMERYGTVLEVQEALTMLLPGEGKQYRRKKWRRWVHGCIGVASVAESQDSMMVSVLFANYFSEWTGKRVALLDLSGSNRLKQMREVFSDCKEQQGEFCGFLLQGVGYYSDVRAVSIGQYWKDYDILVLHFGHRLAVNLAEFLRCEHSYVVGGAMPWQLAAWEELELLFGTGAKKQVTALLTAGQAKELGTGMWKKALRLPAVEDVFLPKGEMARWLQRHLLVG